MQVLPSEVIEEFVSSVILSDSTLVQLMPHPDSPSTCRCYPSYIPQADLDHSNSLPAVVYNWQSSERSVVAEGRYENILIERWVFSVIGRGSGATALAPIYKRLNELLHRASFNGQTGRIESIERLNTVQYPISADNGVIYTRVGGVYRIQVRAF